MPRVRLVVIVLALVAMAAYWVVSAAPACSRDDYEWNYVDDYAPILEFNTLIVDEYPTGFQDDYSGTCAYARWDYDSSGYTFQYWYYYRYDIRFTSEVDAKLDEILTQLLLDANVDSAWLEHEVDKLFHEHDWELVEVHVPFLGSVPDYVTYCAHGGRYTLFTDDWFFPAPMEGKHCRVQIITDMHGSYPPDSWTLPFGWPPDNLKSYAGVVMEFLVAGAWENLASWEGIYSSYDEIEYADKCRPFSAGMAETSWLYGYPCEMPWDKGFVYEVCRD